MCVCVACRLIPWAKVGQESLALTQLPAWVTWGNSVCVCVGGCASCCQRGGGAKWTHQRTGDGARVECSRDREREKELASVVSLAAEQHWTDFTHTYFFPTPPHAATYLRRHTFASFLSCSLLCCIQRGTGSLSFSLSFSSHSHLRTLSFKPRSPWLRHWSESPCDGITSRTVSASSLWVQQEWEKRFTSLHLASGNNLTAVSG